jgi:hypothetical protein
MIVIELNDKLALFYAECGATDHVLCRDFLQILFCLQMTGILLNDKLVLFYAEATDHLLCRDFLQILFCLQMTGIELNDKLALFYAEYGATDHLLCHDDELEGRRVAFILYLAKNWTEEDGGSLDLFAVGKRGVSLYQKLFTHVTRSRSGRVRTHRRRFLRNIHRVAFSVPCR